MLGQLIGRRRPPAWLLVGLGLPLLTAGLIPLQSEVSLAADIQAFLLLVVGVALLGDFAAALVAAVVGFLLLNYFFTPPLHQFTIEHPVNLAALLTFVLVAVIVSSVVDVAARRAREAARARAQAETLATVAGSVLRGTAPLPALLAQIRETFGQDSVTLLEATESGWALVAHAGHPPATAPGEGDSAVALPGSLPLSLVFRGHALAEEDERLVRGLATQAAVALRQERLAEVAAAVEPLAEADRLRTALLAAVSHDLRSPLAAATASVAALRTLGDQLSSADRAELAATAGDSLASLARLVEDLLDMSRLQAGAMTLVCEEVALDEVVATVLDELSIGSGASELLVELPDPCPEVRADPVLLERALANVVANALRFSPSERPPLIRGNIVDGDIDLAVIDYGPGVAAADREQIFVPFQRLGDRDPQTGVGLGLALARGFVEAMGGSLTAAETTGGGLTMHLRLPAAGR